MSCLTPPWTAGAPERRAREKVTDRLNARARRGRGVHDGGGGSGDVGGGSSAPAGPGDTVRLLKGFDGDGDGELTHAEFTKGVNSGDCGALNAGLSDAELAALLRIADPSCSGKITLTHFATGLSCEALYYKTLFIDTVYI
jgi:hypothetical protein